MAWSEYLPPRPPPRAACVWRVRHSGRCPMRRHTTRASSASASPRVYDEHSDEHVRPGRRRADGRPARGAGGRRRGARVRDRHRPDRAAAGRARRPRSPASTAPRRCWRACARSPAPTRSSVDVGDMATTRVDGRVLARLPRLQHDLQPDTQDGQVACFENAAAHLRSRRPVRDRGARARAAAPAARPDGPAVARRPGGISFDVYDVVTQRLSCQHYHFDDGRVEACPIEFRYAGRPSST